MPVARSGGGRSQEHSVRVRGAQGLRNRKRLHACREAIAPVQGRAGTRSKAPRGSPDSMRRLERLRVDAWVHPIASGRRFGRPGERMLGRCVQAGRTERDALSFDVVAGTFRHGISHSAHPLPAQGQADQRPEGSALAREHLTVTQVLSIRPTSPAFPRASKRGCLGEAFLL